MPAPTKLIDGRYFTGGGTIGRTYDVSSDGQRLLMITAPGAGASVPPALIVVQHWDEELKRLVPVTKP